MSNVGPVTITRRGLTCGLAALAACRKEVTLNGGTLPQETREFLMSATAFVVVAVHPAISTPSSMPEGVTERLWSYGVLGRAEVESAAERSELVDLLDQAIASSDGSVAGCFNPRHAISATRGDHRMDVVICFECHAMRVYEGPEKPGSHLIGTAPASRMSEIFRGHGLTLAPARL